MEENQDEKLNEQMADAELNAVSYEAKAPAPVKARKNDGCLKEIAEWLITLALAVLVALAVRNWVVESVIVDKTSMTNTLQPGDRLVGLKLTYRLREPKRGEIVTINIDEDTIYIKRVIGIAGDEILIEGGEVYVNGEALDEPYIRETTEGYFECTVPEGCCFCMGDNRNNSIDSRMLGCFSYDQLRDYIVLRYMPFSEFGAVE